MARARRIMVAKVGAFAVVGVGETELLAGLTIISKRMWTLDQYRK
jgi:hypothetical protein